MYVREVDLKKVYSNLSKYLIIHWSKIFISKSTLYLFSELWLADIDSRRIHLYAEVAQYIN